MDDILPKNLKDMGLQAPIMIQVNVELEGVVIGTLSGEIRLPVGSKGLAGKYFDLSDIIKV